MLRIPLQLIYRVPFGVHTHGYNSSPEFHSMFHSMCVCVYLHFYPRSNTISTIIFGYDEHDMRVQSHLRDVRHPCWLESQHVATHTSTHSRRCGDSDVKVTVDSCEHRIFSYRAAVNTIGRMPIQAVWKLSEKYSISVERKHFVVRKKFQLAKNAVTVK